LLTHAAAGRALARREELVELDGKAQPRPNDEQNAHHRDPAQQEHAVRPIECDCCIDCRCPPLTYLLKKLVHVQRLKLNEVLSFCASFAKPVASRRR
jgi:hypothetical protein